MTLRRSTLVTRSRARYRRSSGRRADIVRLRHGRWTPGLPSDAGGSSIDSDGQAACANHPGRDRYRRDGQRDSHSYAGSSVASHDGRPKGRFSSRRAGTPRTSVLDHGRSCRTGAPFEIDEGVAVVKHKKLGDLKTGPLSSIEGRVTWKGTNKPVEDGRVHVLRLWDHKVAQWLVMRETPHFPIDSAGGYRIPGLPPGRYEIGFWTEKAQVEVRVVVFPNKATSRRLDVEIHRGRSYSGKVVDQEGKAIDRALLRALPAFPTPARTPSARPPPTANHTVAASCKGTCAS